MARALLVLFAVLLLAACGSAVGIEGASLLRSRTIKKAEQQPNRTPSAPHPASPVAKKPKPSSKKKLTPLRIKAFAKVIGGLPLFHPTDHVERVGFHQAYDPAAQKLFATGDAAHPKELPSRGRGTSRRSAADIVVDPQSKIYAPTSGIVKRSGTYSLYCKHQDGFVTISPDGHPELEVKMLHISGVRVRPGDRVEAGKSVIAKRPRRLPFSSQVDAFTENPHWPHVHMEVAKLAVPSAVPAPAKLLQTGC